MYDINVGFIPNKSTISQNVKPKNPHKCGILTKFYGLVEKFKTDFLTGLIAAALCKSGKTDSGGLSSSVGFKGIAKKVGIMLLVLIAHRIDLVLGTNYIKTAAVIAFIVNEVISIVENAGLIGVPMPAIFKKAVDLLKGKADEDGAEK